MKRKNRLHYRSIKQAVYYTIRGIILLPIKLVLWPFKLLRRAVFYRKPKLNKTVLTIIFNKLRGINKRIDELHNRMLIHYKVEDKIQNRIKILSDTINLNGQAIINNEKRGWRHLERICKLEDRDKVLSDRINNQLSLIRDIEDKLESTDASIDLGEFNFINTDDETDELLQIEAEMLGSSVAKEEYDWHCEQKAKNKQIQDRMRADEEIEANLSKNDKIRLKNMSSSTDVSKFNLNPEDD